MTTTTGGGLDVLALVDPARAGAGKAWHHYLTPWTVWNHVRAAPSPSS